MGKNETRCGEERDPSGFLGPIFLGKPFDLNVKIGRVERPLAISFAFNLKTNINLHSFDEIRKTEKSHENPIFWRRRTRPVLMDETRFDGS